METVKVVKLSQALKSFICAKEAANRAERTIEKYTYILSDFIDQTGDLELPEVDEEAIERYMSHKHRNGSRPASLETYYLALKAFWKWCERKYGIVNPMRFLEKPHVPRRLPKFLRDHEVAALFEALERTRNSLRNRAILMTFLGTGIRLGELINLEKSKVDFNSREVWVFGKDQEERAIPIEPEVAEAITAYWNTRSDTTNWAFLSTTGKRYTASGLRALIERLGEFSGITVHVHPHLLRHTFAHNWLARGGDMDTLRMILGHSNLVMTQRYANTVIEDVKRVHARVAPIGRFVKDK